MAKVSGVFFYFILLIVCSFGIIDKDCDSKFKTSSSFHEAHLGHILSYDQD